MAIFIEFDILKLLPDNIKRTAYCEILCNRISKRIRGDRLIPSGSQIYVADQFIMVRFRSGLEPDMDKRLGQIMRDVREIAYAEQRALDRDLELFIALQCIYDESQEE